MKAFRLLVLVLTLAVITSCGKEDVNPEESNRDAFELYIDFWNPNGNDPQISFDAENSSPEVKIDFSQTFAGVAVPPHFTNVIIDNVRLIDENNVNYRIDEIEAYEWRTDINDWKIDVEFVMEFDQVDDLALVLVLDASASLGDDFGKVKAFANNFIDQVLEKIPSAKIGIVDFSDDINSFGLSNNQASLASYIESINQGPFTTMYEAIALGIDMLNATSAESKAILTFTDGTDNNSKPQYTPSYILDQLKGGTDEVKINSFTIGFDGNGGVDKPVLEAIASQSGAAAFPNTIEELESVFKGFSESVSTVYNLTYIRNQQVIPETDPAKLKFVLQSTPKIF